jgi:hypothetical protein
MQEKIAPWGYLRLLEERREPVMRQDLHGVEYDSGEEGPTLWDLLCACGHEFTIRKRDFPGKRRMRTCGRDECQYAQYEHVHRPRGPAFASPQAVKQENTRLKTLLSTELGVRAEDRAEMRVNTNADNMLAHLGQERQIQVLRQQLGRPQLPPEQQAVVVSVRVPIHMLESIARLMKQLQMSRNQLIVSFIRTGIRTLEKED